MFQIKVNRKLLPMKINYFLYFACIGPIYGFLPTYTRQLGYSMTVFGAMMTIVSLLEISVAPAVGIFVDKFRVKKTLFTMTVLMVGIMTFSLMFAPKVPSSNKAVAELKFDTKTSEIVLAVYAGNIRQGASEPEDNGSIACELSCQDTKWYDCDVTSMNNNNNNNCSGLTAVDGIEHSARFRNRIGVTLNSNNETKRIKIENSYVFRASCFKINGTRVLSSTTACQNVLNTTPFCHIDFCSNVAAMDIATDVITHRVNVLGLYQFWIFFVAVITLWTSATMSSVLQNPICLDLLEDRPEDFGKQKCWASIGWGFSSIYVGWLVDRFSIGKTEKDYSPIFYSSAILTIFNLFVITKINVVETKKSKGKWKNVRGLFTKHNVIAFYIWTVIKTFLHTIITHYLFWYMEDLVSENDDRNQMAWLKTLQGLIQGIQCFGGEIPFFFLSGWIIKTMGHINCMALVLGTMAVRMYLYTIIENPVWIIFIELLNGISFALGFAVKMSYAKNISPPGTSNTVIGFVGFFDHIGECLGSMIGGYLFGSYGGVWSFRFFAYCSAFACFLNVLSNIFGFTKNLKNANFVAISTEMNQKT